MSLKLQLLIGIVVVLVIAGIIVAIAAPSHKTNTPTTNTGVASSNSNSITIKNPTTANNVPIDSSQDSTPTVTPEQYSGTGDDVVTITKPTDSPAILTFNCPDCTDNTIVQTNGADSLIVNTIGSYSGSHIIDTAQGSNTTQVTITATGSWTLNLDGLDKATEMDTSAISGTGDSVIYADGGTSTAQVTNTGQDNFIVTVYPADGGHAALPINTIGSYNGTVPLATPAYVQIESDGTWSVTPED